MLIKSYESTISDLDLLNWVESQQNNTKFYLKLRDQDWEWSGVGNLFESPKALVPTMDWVLEDYEDFLSEHDNLKYFVAHKFDFTSFVVLPRFEILKNNNKVQFKLNLWESESPDEFQNQFSKNMIFEKPTLQQTQHIPSATDWVEYFNKAHAQLSESYLQKIVLARKTIASFDKPLDAYEILRKLSQNSYQCLFQLDGETQNISVSPERLFKIENNILYSEAIAGTRPRGINNKEDSVFETELKNSNKDQYEHQLVIDDIYRILQNFASIITVDETKVIKQKKVQHLKTEIQADLFSNLWVSDIIKQLHPTPAVGGLPRKAVANWLQEHEPFTRDFYASPVGIMSKDFNEFFVNIRSAQIQGKNIKLYSGVGIVKDSNAESEWQEMDAKLKQYWDVL